MRWECMHALCEPWHLALSVLWVVDELVKDDPHPFPYEGSNVGLVRAEGKRQARSKEQNLWLVRGFEPRCVDARLQMRIEGGEDGARRRVEVGVNVQ